MIKAQIAGDFLSDGISVRVLMEGDGARMILLPGGDGWTRWEPFDPGQGAAETPGLTIRLPDEAGRALLDALLRHYQGASDMHTVRSDLLHERGRVDKLTDALIRLADAARQGLWMTSAAVSGSSCTGCSGRLLSRSWPWPCSSRSSWPACFEPSPRLDLHPHLAALRRGGRMSGRLRHFYHLYCGRPWQGIASAHVKALRESGADWEVTAGIVGPDDARDEAQDWFRRAIPEVTFTCAREGWEQVTLRVLHGWVQSARPDEPVFYAHSKGVTNKGGAGTAAPGLLGKVWRESMTRYLVDGWRECVKLLEDHDAVGCHWVTPQTHPGYVTDAMFAGNFWWVRAGYASLLPVPSGESRYHAEGWIGLKGPAVADLRPGWPSLALFAQDTVAFLNPDTQVEVFNRNDPAPAR